MKQKYLDLFITFAKIGLFTFGGGYAMISIIENECVEKKKWITHEDMMNVTVIAESTPGPIAINCASFVGYKRAGMMGASAATIGMVLPSFIIIYIISRFLSDFLAIRWIANAFKGIKVAVGVLICNAAFKMIKNMKKSLFYVGMMGIAFGIIFMANLFAWKVSSISLIVVAALVTMSLYIVAGESVFEKGNTPKGDEEK